MEDIFPREHDRDIRHTGGFTLKPGLSEANNMLNSLGFFSFPSGSQPFFFQTGGWGSLLSGS
jgi:hypothetical protein